MLYASTYNSGHSGVEISLLSIMYKKHKQEHDSLFQRLIALVYDILIDAAEDSCNPPLSPRCCITHNIFLCENQSFD